MLVRFLRDFQGRATNELFYEVGAKVDLDSGIARACIAEGAAEAIPLVAREGQAAPAPSANPPAKKPEPPRTRQGGRHG